MNATAKIWLVVMALLTAAIVVPIGYLGVRGIIDDTRLTKHGKPLCAPVTEYSTVTTRHGIDYELKYRFEIDRKGYGHSDETGRSDLWANVPESDWRDAQRRGCIDIIYLPGDPSVNAPARSPTLDDPIGNKIAALVMCALCLGLFLAGARGILRVARTRLWRFAIVDGDTWSLARDAEEQRIHPGEIRKARYITLPRARVHPPWRFPSDVMALRMIAGEELWVAAPHGELVTRAIQQLDARGVLKRKRSG